MDFSAPSDLNEARGLKGKDDPFKSRIVGGEEARTDEFPFMVSWHQDQNMRNHPLCGGSLVADNLVLTAAHCQYTHGGVRIGSKIFNTLDDSDVSPGVERQVMQKIKHPSYTGTSGNQNDYMLLVLDQSVDTMLYPPIDLNFDANDPTPGSMLTTVGFGTLSFRGSQPNILQKLNVPMVSQEVCDRQYNGVINETVHLCAGYEHGEHDACQGDSGGPIFREVDTKQFRQYGVVSWGRGCAMAHHSGIYARTSGASEWLVHNVCTLRGESFTPSYCESFHYGNEDNSERINEDNSEGIDEDDFAEEDDDFVDYNFDVEEDKTTGITSDLENTEAPVAEPTELPTAEPTKAPTTEVIGKTGFETSDDDNPLFAAKMKRTNDTDNAYAGEYYLLLKNSKRLASKDISISPTENTQLQLDFHYKTRNNVNNFQVAFKFGDDAWTKVKDVSVTPGSGYSHDTITVPIANNIQHFKVKDVSVTPGSGYSHDTITVPIANNIQHFKFRFASTGEKVRDKLYIDDVTLKRISNGSTEDDFVDDSSEDEGDKTTVMPSNLENTEASVAELTELPTKTTTVEPTTEPTKTPTVEPTEAPTKAPVVTTPQPTPKAATSIIDGIIGKTGFETLDADNPLFHAKKKRTNDADDAYDGEYYLLLKSSKQIASKDISISPMENTQLQLDFHYKSRNGVHNFQVAFKFGDDDWTEVKDVSVIPDSDYSHDTITVPIANN
eukprot:CAMPEP_0194160710 /NCGR_PEP_ID=MMETSP0152-20130528/78540_1 /TAXON_ID=1049557 /ORGANISM="Thalassiothrix antarctica, Strain L6-D1" /LENGTH=722 /DNA_ID=CAMNT_0038870423 /DNA_START=131 /DNA_END=2297 /DNA_ORIENTATION=+